MTSRLFLTGIAASGRHGANPGEKDQAQDFVVDLDVEVEVGDDELTSTADYRTLIRTARETVERDSFDLLESLAHAVARDVLALDGVVKVSAIVHKPAAARSSEVQGIAAAATVSVEVATAAFLALGSNLGDRLEHLRAAARKLDATPGIDVVRSSRVYETEPVGPPQPPYLNAVIEVVTTLTPRELLEAAGGVEDSLGRVRGERWGPRTIDVDILVYDEQTIDEPDLVIPHPRMHERGFVLVPLGELDADAMLPGGRRLSSHRLSPDAVFGVRPFAPPLPIP